MQPALTLATYEDLLALPEGARAEVCGGVVVTAPAPRPRHSKAQRALGRFVGGPFDDDDGAGGPGGWWIFAEVDVRLALHEIVRPDLAGWRRARLPVPDVLPIDVVPDWVCEVLSPSNASRDRVDKRLLYARSGVAHYWLADPQARTLETLALRDGRWVDTGAFGEADLARIPPFEEIEIPVGRLFLPRSATRSTPVDDD